MLYNQSCALQLIFRSKCVGWNEGAGWGVLPQRDWKSSGHLGGYCKDEVRGVEGLNYGGRRIERTWQQITCRTQSVKGDFQVFKLDN